MSGPSSDTNRSEDDTAVGGGSENDTGSSLIDGVEGFHPGSDGGGGDGAETESSRAERLRKNREKARDRRNRKKALVEDMQRNVVVLSKMNADLKKKNAALLGQLAQYGPAGHTGDIQPVDVSQNMYEFRTHALTNDGLDVSIEHIPIDSKQSSSHQTRGRYSYK